MARGRCNVRDVMGKLVIGEENPRICTRDTGSVLVLNPVRPANQLLFCIVPCMPCRLSDAVVSSPSALFALATPLRVPSNLVCLPLRHSSPPFKPSTSSRASQFRSLQHPTLLQMDSRSSARLLRFLPHLGTIQLATGRVFSCM